MSRKPAYFFVISNVFTLRFVVLVMNIEYVCVFTNMCLFLASGI